MDKLERYERSRKQMEKESSFMLKEKLNTLVETYGIEAVAAATGLKFSTISTYLSTRNPKISESKLIRAEKILQQQ